MKIVLTLCALTLFACHAAEDPMQPHGLLGSATTNPNTEVPLDVCQPRYNEAGAFCASQRCEAAPVPCDSPFQDDDCDGVADYGIQLDNCTRFCNPQQENADGDYMGDACDPCPQDSGNDIDKDGLCANADNCPHVANQAQANADGDAYGDACDDLPNTSNPETVIAALDTRLDALEAAGTPAAIAALQYDIAALSAALAEIRTKYPQHYHGLLGLNGNPVGNSGDLNYSLPGDP